MILNLPGQVRNFWRKRRAFLVFLLLFPAMAQAAPFLSPAAIVASPSADQLYIACATANQVAVFDTRKRKVTRLISVEAQPLGLSLSSDGKTLFVTCAAAESTVCIIDVGAGKTIAKIGAGHTAMAPALSPDGQTLFVCYRFENAIGVINVAARKEVRRFPVSREPIDEAMTPDGKYLLVAHHLHGGRADVEVVASKVSVIDIAAGKVCREIELPNGSTLLRDIRISPDARYAVVTHLLARFHLPTTQIERGWINSNAASLIDLAELRLLNTVLLDNIDAGAANPWGVTWTGDGGLLCITHAGTHEVSVIDFPGLLAKLAKVPATPASASNPYARGVGDVPNDLAFLESLRRRIKLPEADRGPRAVAAVGDRLWVANYFSDSVTRIDLSSAAALPESIPLAAPRPMTAVRRGELLFNDASICFQGWQSCASCHSSDARVDGLNWDNLNDGIGNPKNVKNLLFAHATPPSMWLGVRSNAYVSVRAGIRNSLFTVQSEEKAADIDEYLKSLKPIPSPYLVKGALSKAAERGKKLFFDRAVGCADCHKGELFTDQKLHDVGTVGRFDKASDRFDTPSLRELWRTAPYLHDGRARTVQEVLTTFQTGDHGDVSHLTAKQIDDLVEYVLSL